MSVIPAVRWLHQQDRSAEPYLRDAGLPVDPVENPLRPVPLLYVARLVKALAEVGGPDVSCKIVSSASMLELALLGRVALGARTPTEALSRIAAALPLFCSHEYLVVTRGAKTLAVRHSYGVTFEPEVEHLVFQYAAAMVGRLCAATGAAAPLLQAVKIPPHPVHGVAHLRRWFGTAASSLPGHALEVIIKKEIADRGFPVIARDRSRQMKAIDIAMLRGDGSLSSSVLIALASMLEDRLPTLDELASISGMSTRTLQRRLLEEGTSFSRLLEQVRHSAAVRRLKDSRQRVGAIATDLGYAHQASLTRSMRRWTGEPPMRFRSSDKTGK